MCAIQSSAVEDHASLATVCVVLTCKCLAVGCAADLHGVQTAGIWTSVGCQKSLILQQAHPHNASHNAHATEHASGVIQVTRYPLLSR